ncbi:MAG: hypothetical protein VX385_05815, partial [Acidobacteriota bacterium]|nr:hypothetical protein [Acidobacteriota bacterium]
PAAVPRLRYFHALTVSQLISVGALYSREAGRPHAGLGSRAGEMVSWRDGPPGNPRNHSNEC